MDKIIVWAPSLGMRNLQYEISIYQKIHNPESHNDTAQCLTLLNKWVRKRFFADRKEIMCF